MIGTSDDDHPCAVGELGDRDDDASTTADSDGARAR